MVKMWSCLIIAACMSLTSAGWYDPPNASEQLRSILDRLEERQLPGRVSFKECNLDPGYRLDCGHFGITEDQCYTRGCCWGESNTPDVPWCYHSIPTIEDKCMMSGEERIECGSYGIRKEQCLASNCCWQPSSNNGEPWCYHYKRVEMPGEGECGIPAILPNVRRLPGSRIVGGVEAKPHSWPWQISMQVGGLGHGCGGSILNENWVVSAAHCESAFDYGNVQIVVGAHGVNDDASSRQTIPVSDRFPHEHYNWTTLNNDIMLIKLESPIQFLDEVKPICLPDPNKMVVPGTRCYITGWGTTTLFGESPEYLQQVMTPIIDPKTCAEWYSDPQHWYDDNLEGVPVITDQMICTGYEEGGRGGCHGDSGGPMVCYADDHWELQGVVSWGGPCAYERTPSVFARVSQFTDWIETTINNNQK